MPSIFVWKAEQPVASKDTITYFMGDNWYMEENANQVRSVQYRDQRMLSNGVLVWDGVCMPESWVGSYILDTIKVPYQLLKTDGYATLEQIGDWMRCTVHKPNSFESYELEEEYKRIQTWRNTPSYIIPNHNVPQILLPSLPVIKNIQHMKPHSIRTQRPMYRV